MKVSDCMTRDVRLTAPTQTLREAAKLMAEMDIGALPVGDNDRLIGMVTDRDIAVRGVARGLGPDTPVRDVMTEDVKYCFADQTIEEVSRNMGDIQVRRLPVVDRQKRLVGIISLSDIANGDGAIEEAGEALRDISQPGGEHSQRLTH
ncbi:MAG TPA: CBS domain-containing protein [Steroidobacteraceae bacterium]